MIHPYSPSTLRRWTRGEFTVQVLVPGSTRAVAYCDGTDEDVRELTDRAESEGAEVATIHRRVLKTGREVWTIGVAEPDAIEE